MFLQQLLNGLILGGAYSLISVGLTMSFGIMNITNFAHGTLYMLGGYAMYFFSTVWSLPFFLSVATAIVTVGLLGIVFERVVFRRVYEGPEINSLLISLGLLIFLENTALLLWGSEVVSVKAPYNEIMVSVFSAKITLQRIVVLISSLVIISGLFYFLNFSKFGKSILATAQNPKGAALVGINIPKIYMSTFAISAGLAAAGGALLAPLFYVFPTMGSMPLLKAFVVVVLGGMGNVQGAVAGGFLVGIVESLGGGYISSEYKNAFAFIILIGVLLIRPQGIFGRNTKN